MRSERLAQRFTLSPIGLPSSLASADFNGDGMPDVVVPDGQVLTLLINQVGE